jgi:hypothetical protein
MGIHDYVGMDSHAVPALGLSDDSVDDIGQLGRRVQEKSAMNCPGGDFNNGTVGKSAAAEA